MATITGGSIVTINNKQFYKFSTAGANSGTITFPYDITANILIVAGGGGGGGGYSRYESAGGGGAGGVGYGTLNFVAGITYNITVGEGGSGANYITSLSSDQPNGVNGGNSSVIGGTISAIAVGGGGGVSGKQQYNAISGGSGGGGAGIRSGGIVNTNGRGEGLTWLGFNGRSGASAAGGGGGGASAAAGNASGENNPGTGGNGFTWTDTNQIYGGGGGGGVAGSFYNASQSSTGGAGGTGGGGTGGGGLNAATNGSPNTGGGGGGAISKSGFGNGGSGGSGIVLIQVISPWGAYIAGHPSNTSTLLYDTTGNGKHATISGSGCVLTTRSGNGAKNAIPFLVGTQTSTIEWPSGSIPTTFTILSVTRYWNAGSIGGRILNSNGTNWLQGHWGGVTGVAYYVDGWKTDYANVPADYNWCVVCGTNDANVSSPNNILVNGIPKGTANGGTGGGMLSINPNNTSEKSDFAFQQVKIWNTGLSASQMAFESAAMLAYLNDTSTAPPARWGSYIAGHPSNTSTLLYDTTGNGRHATIDGSGCVFTVGSGNGAENTIPYLVGTKNTKITWPAGSIPSTFTILSVTRYLNETSTNKRILDGSGGLNSFYQGHYEGLQGQVSYGSSAIATKVASGASPYVSIYNWVVACGTNNSAIATPNNILINGVPSGTFNAGTGNGTLVINNGSNTTEYSDFAFQQLIIWDASLTAAQMKTESDAVLAYLNISPTFPTAWGSYIAGHPSNTSTLLYDRTGNGRHATISGDGCVLNTGSGNGATNSIPYLVGTKNTTITWPEGSIPSTFTILSVTRYLNASTNTLRIFDGSGINVLHGHHSGSSGVAFYDGWVTNLNIQSPYISKFDWCVACGTNSGSVPNNFFVNGIASGVNNITSSGGNKTLTINNGDFSAVESSDFAFQQVTIWNTALTAEQMKTASDAVLAYLKTSTTIPTAWGSYIAGHPNNTSTLLYDTTGNGQHATISGQGCVLNTGSGNRATNSIPYLVGTKNTTITWPEGSIPTTFTILSVTRYLNEISTNNRILDACGSNVWTHGHYLGNSGVGRYSSWKTSQSQSPYTSKYDWCVMCSTNSDSVSAPNNILVNGVAAGISNGGYGNDRLIINGGSFNGPIYDEKSDFAFQQVTIWNTSLTADQMFAASQSVLTYLGYNSFDDLVLYCPLNNDYNNYATSINGTATDISTNKVSFSSTFSIHSSIYNKSLYYPGDANTNQRLLFNKIPTLSVNKGVTISMWAKFIKLPVAGTGPNYRLFEFNGLNPLILYVGTKGISAASNPDLRLFLYDTYYTLGTTITDTLWHNYTLTLSPLYLNSTNNISNINFNCNVYIDTMTVYTGTFNAIKYPSLNDLSNLLVGQSFNQDHYDSYTQPIFYINNFIIYNRELTKSQIYNTLYKPFAELKYPNLLKFNYWGLVKYYPFDKDLINYALETPTADGNLVNDSGNTKITTETTKLTSGSLYLSGGTTRSNYFKISDLNLKRNGFTIATWMKFKQSNIRTDKFYRVFDFGSGQGDKNIVLSFGTSANNTIYGIAVLYFAAFFNFTQKINQGFTNMRIGYLSQDWNHYCLIVSNGASFLFVNGFFVDVTASDNNSYTFDASLTSCFIGSSNWSEDDTNAYFNSFMVFNRPIGQSEISSIMENKNVVINGNFNSVRMMPNTVYSLSNGSQSTNDINYNCWDVTGGNAYISNGSPSQYISNSLINNQQYYIAIPFTSAGTSSLYQSVYLTAGSYTLKYNVIGRTLQYNTAHTLVSNILNYGGDIIMTHKPTINNASITKVSQNFTINTSGLHSLQFISNYTVINFNSTIFLTAIEIVQLTNSYSNKLTDIGGAVATFDRKSTLYSLTNPYKNNFASLYYKAPNISLFNDRPFYMHGPRNTTGFMVNGTDIGYYYQQSSPFDGSYGYCFNIFYNNDAVFFERPIERSYGACIIWPENVRNQTNSLPQGLVNGVTYWIYYTFYYAGLDNSGTVYVKVDNVGTFYFNTSNPFIINNNDSSYTVRIKNGLNYIRVAIYNSEASNTNPAGFIMAILDSSGNVVAVTNQNWTWSITQSPYNTSAYFSNTAGALPFIP